MKITREPFGRTIDKKKVDQITLSNDNGYACTFITLGARLISFKGPDKRGKVEELTKTPKELSELEAPGCYYGATIGRYTNRITGGTFEIDGTVYTLDKNQPHCQLHGGERGLHTKVWEAFPMRESTRASIKFTHTSADGEMGFPGELDVAVTVTLTEGNELFFVYEAASDKPTYAGMTNHTFWNLSGNLTDRIYDHQVSIGADRIITVDEDLLPTGEYTGVTGTRFDLRTMQPLGKLDAGYDHCFVMEERKGVVEAAEVYEPSSGREMRIITDAPGLQFYTDNFDLEDQHRSFCLEAQEIPDGMNHPAYYSRVLRPGELYRQVTIHSFSVR